MKNKILGFLVWLVIFLLSFLITYILPITQQNTFFIIYVVFMIIIVLVLYEYDILLKIFEIFLFRAIELAIAYFVSKIMGIEMFEVFQIMVLGKLVTFNSKH